MIFYVLFLIPISTKKEKIDKIPSDNFQEENKKDNKDKNIQEENKEDDKNDVILKINTVNTEKEFNNYINTEMEVIKSIQSSPKKNELTEETKTGDVKDKSDEIYSTKICTLCGYIYTQRVR